MHFTPLATLKRCWIKLNRTHSPKITGVISGIYSPVKTPCPLRAGLTSPCYAGENGRRRPVASATDALSDDWYGPTHQEQRSLDHTVKTLHYGFTVKHVKTVKLI